MPRLTAGTRLLALSTALAVLFLTSGARAHPGGRQGGRGRIPICPSCRLLVLP
jgi:hypothetical protein